MTARWKQTIDRYGTVVLTAAAPPDPAAEVVRRKALKDALDRVAGIVARTPPDADPTGLEAALDDILAETIDVLDPEEAA